ncbi:MAG: hypothetical protein ACIAQZ_15955 [Sedimentisphaeraceae bacterium JB056]
MENIGEIKKKYYWLLGLNMLVLVLKLISVKMSASIIPGEVYDPAIEYINQKISNTPMLLSWAIGWLHRFMPIIYALSILGLFVGIVNARRFYVFVVCANVLLLLIPFTTFCLSTNYVAFLAAIGHIIEGIVIYLIFWGKAAVLFESNELWQMKRSLAKPAFFQTPKGRKVGNYLLVVIVVLIISLLTVAITGIGSMPSLLNTPDEFVIKGFNNRVMRKYDLSSKTIVNEFFSLTSPNGWHTQDCDNRPSINISNRFWRELPEDDFFLEPRITFSDISGLPDKKPDESIPGGLYNFLMDNPETETFEKDINGKSANVFRYSGNKSWHFRMEDMTATNETVSTTILVEFEGIDYGFIFWGFEEDETVFWDCLSSINWKE